MLSRLLGRGRRPKPPTLDLDVALDDLALRTARDRALAGTWTAARDVVVEAGADWELRARRVAVLSDAAASNGGWLSAWLQAAPDDAAAVTIKAATLGAMAGEARGAQSAAHTSPKQFQAFAELSEASAETGRRAIALAGPHDPVPHIELLGAMFADGRVNTREYQVTLSEARGRDPHNFELHLTVVSLLCEKWYGSHDRMFAAARDAAEAAPPGANAVMLPFLAHFEFAMREHGWDQRTAESLAACSRHFHRPEVQQELDGWAAKWRAGTPTPGRGMTCRHWLALAHFLTGRRPEARAVMDEIGSYFGSTVAWAYFFGDAAGGYQAAWRWAHRDD